MNNYFGSYPSPESYNPYSAYPYYNKVPIYSDFWRQNIELKDYGPNPLIVNIKEATMQNTNFRASLWTGAHFQLTLMNINAGEEIGIEMHPNVDQFICIIDGQALIKMGDRQEALNFEQNVNNGFAIIIPAGSWHNLINTGTRPLKLYSIYAPVQHPYGTVHKTKV